MSDLSILNPLELKALELQQMLEERPSGERLRVARLDRQYASAASVAPAIYLSLRALVLALSECYPDNGFLMWLRKLFGYDPVAALKARAEQPDMATRIRAERIVREALREHGDDNTRGIRPSEFVGDATALVRGMSHDDFAALIRSVQQG